MSRLEWLQYAAGKINPNVEMGGVLALNEISQGIGVHASSQGYGMVAEGGNVALYASHYTSGNNAYLRTVGLAGDFYGDVYIHGKLTAEGH